MSFVFLLLLLLVVVVVFNFRRVDNGCGDEETEMESE
jgi:Na+-transporting methylmalonyl-CoA/oxaloacetate decarboxylase gamma subunit